MSNVLDSAPATQWALNSGVKFRVSFRPGLWNRLNYPANRLGFPDSLTLGHRENGQTVIGAWGRTAEWWWWVRLGQTHRDEGSLTEEGPFLPQCLFPQVPPDMMAWPWLSCLLLPAFTVSGGCSSSPTRAALTWGPLGFPPHQTPSFIDPALCLAALGRSGEEYRPIG